MGNSTFGMVGAMRDRIFEIGGVWDFEKKCEKGGDNIVLKELFLRLCVYEIGEEKVKGEERKISN